MTWFPSVILTAVLAVGLTSKQRSKHGGPPSAAELLMVRPNTAATPLTAGNAVRIDKLQQHVDDGKPSNDSAHQDAAKRTVAAVHEGAEKHSGGSLKSYYAQLVNKKLLPTVQEQCQGKEHSNKFDFDGT